MFNVMCCVEQMMVIRQAKQPTNNDQTIKA